MPSGVRHFTARQLGIRDITVLAEYGQRENTRREHAALIRQHYQYREFAWPWTFRLTRLLYTRSWISNERPGLLFDLATGWLMQHRIILHLRLSITDVCNFRCTYCLPNGYKPGAVNNNGFLSVDEVRRVTRAFSALGTEKVRLTGGEPSLRRDFTEIIAAVRENPAIRQIAVTTNGYRLARDVERWRAAGLTAINVSVDSLDARQFHAITGQDKFHQVMDGIDAAFAAGFDKVKVNTVLMRDVNHHQLDTFLAWIQPRRIQLRFIELMETGEGSDLFRRHHLSGMVLRDELLRRGWIHQIRQRSDGPAQVFCHPDYAGEIGLIMPYEKDFCATCNRLRVSSVGKLHLCLFGEGGVDLRDLMAEDQQQAALEARIAEALTHKKQTHFLHQGNTGITQNLSYIGG
ncbi:TPA: GTP 3',8-cyclase MoaA [Klebsiella pneumoniae]|nr:GTP 3',8-cyclase MoaA [Klebsiella pneumoniae]